MLLNARQQQELVKYLLSKEKQNGGSADNLCIRSGAYGLQTKTEGIFTEIHMGLILLPGAAAGTGGWTSGRSDGKRI